MGVLTNAQVATLQRNIAVANNVLPKLELLEALSNINTSMQSRVKELRINRDYLISLSEAALAIDRQITPQAGPTATGNGKGKPADPGMMTSWTDGTFQPVVPNDLATGATAPGNRYRIDIGSVVTDDAKGWLMQRGLTPFFESTMRKWAFEGTWDDEREFRRIFGKT